MIINSYNLIDRDLCVICPTRERPEKLQRMYDSFIETKCGKTAIILCVDVDDKTEYNYNCAISVEPHKTNTEIINDIFSKYPNFKYYMVINDDIVFKTIGWDIVLKQKGINFPEDGTNRKFPTFSVIDGDIPRALGWLQMPRLEYLCGDLVWDFIGKQLNILKYNPSVLIDHNHFLFGANKDSISEHTHSHHKKDHEAFAQWLLNDMYNDIRKVKNVYGK